MRWQAFTVIYLLGGAACSAPSSCGSTVKVPSHDGAAGGGSSATSVGSAAVADRIAGADSSQAIGPLAPALGAPGVWEEVTSPDMDPALFRQGNVFGIGNVVVDPARPAHMYVGGYGSI
jgi:hypothetical protein